MSFSVRVKGGLVSFDAQYNGHRKPTDVHIHLGSKDGPALIGYDHIPDEINPAAGFKLEISEANPTLPRDEKGRLKWNTSFTLVWTFAEEPREEEDPDHPVYPSWDEKLEAFLKGIAEFLRRRDKCFIATAAFGSPLEPEVVRLQLWRERVLRPRRTGRALIVLYALLSPPLAALIERRRDGVLGALVRRGLRGVLRVIDRG